ncbi:hypothetical protein DID88_000128 [Monilinia fructigena]|uniref:Uncharacterized protein n=1 Tax=Monilinia fructigena TaxID=38457 RepID=A0A395IJ03_9HELO|nr:hypothetical protein DID88_000128 [Monilinia fructigena]
MSSKKGAYETNASDTDFRKKYDREANVAKAREQEAKEKEEGRLRYEAKLAGKKYYAPLTGDETLTSARAIVSMYLPMKTGEVQRASAEDVRRRIDEIWRGWKERSMKRSLVWERGWIRRIEDEKIERRGGEEEKSWQRGKRKEKEKEVAVKKEYGEDVRVEGEHDEDDMMASMGIVGFGSSKK